MAFIKSIVERDLFFPVLALYGAILVLLLIRKPLKARISSNKTIYRGCEPPRTHPASTRFFGLPYVLKIVEAAREAQVPDFFCSIFDDTGPEVHTVAQSLLGKENYWTRDPDNIKHLLFSGFGDWKLPYARTTAFHHCWGGGIFGADGPQWKKSRALVRPAFKTSLTHDTELLERHVQNLIKRIPAGETVDLGDLFPLFTMDVATDILFNESTSCLDPVKAGEGQMFASSFNYVMKQMSIHVTAPFTRYFYNPKLKKSTKFVFDFTDSFINQALQTETKNTDVLNGEKTINEVSFISRLSSINKSSEILRSELLSLMVAGRDTTAALLGIVWWHLSRRTDILEKLRLEIAHLNGKAPSVKELKGLGYLESLVNEGKYLP